MELKIENAIYNTSPRGSWFKIVRAFGSSEAAGSRLVVLDLWSIL